jgi:predicted Zn-dependent protease
MRCGLCCMLAALMGVAGGCATDDSAIPRVPDSPFGTTVVPPGPTRASFAPASTAAAARVDAIGRTLLSANPQTGLRPLFVTIGAPQPEVFHRGTADIDITEGLVNQCATDGQLAAILCQELGKMVAEREALACARSRRGSDEPMPAVRITNDSASDLTYLAEQAKYRAPAAREAAHVMPDPQVLARDYLTRAGYPPTELDNAEPLLRAAAANARMEKQLNPGPARPWTN